MKKNRAETPKGQWGQGWPSAEPASRVREVAKEWLVAGEPTTLDRVSDYAGYLQYLAYLTPAAPAALGMQAAEGLAVDAGAGNSARTGFTAPGAFDKRAYQEISDRWDKIDAFALEGHKVDPPSALKMTKEYQHQREYWAKFKALWEAGSPVNPDGTGILDFRGIQIDEANAEGIASSYGFPGQFKAPTKNQAQRAVNEGAYRQANEVSVPTTEQQSEALRLSQKVVDNVPPGFPGSPNWWDKIPMWVKLAGGAVVLAFVGSIAMPYATIGASMLHKRKS